MQWCREAEMRRGQRPVRQRAEDGGDRAHPPGADRGARYGGRILRADGLRRVDRELQYGGRPHAAAERADCGAGGERGADLSVGAARVRVSSTQRRRDAEISAENAFGKSKAERAWRKRSPSFARIGRLKPAPPQEVSGENAFDAETRRKAFTGRAALPYGRGSDWSRQAARGTGGTGARGWLSARVKGCEQTCFPVVVRTRKRNWRGDESGGIQSAVYLRLDLSASARTVRKLRPRSVSTSCQTPASYE